MRRRHCDFLRTYNQSTQILIRIVCYFALAADMAFIVHPFISRFQNQSAVCSRRKKSHARFVCVGPHDVDSDSIAETCLAPVRVALTREIEKNEALYEALRLIYPRTEIVRLPCIETVSGEDSDKLPDALKKETYGWIVITSPEAASVFIEAWRKADYPSTGRISVVGQATGDILRAVGIKVSFQPSKATGKTLVQEFPKPEVDKELVLYPSSAKASNVIVDGLNAIGYTVIRLKTYSTEPVTFTDKYRFIGKGSHIVTFASPSAVKSWVRNVGVGKEVSVACIGETSAGAAREAGFEKVYCPEKPGLEGWISAVCEAIKQREDKSLEAR